MLTCFSTEKSNVTPIILVTVSGYSTWLEQQTEAIKTWMSSTQFRAEAGAVRMLPATNGTISAVVCCISDKQAMWDVGHLAMLLPVGNYQFDFSKLPKNDVLQERLFAISWGLGAYQFTKYKQATRKSAILIVDKNLLPEVENIVESTYLTRDLINTPTEDLGPSEFAEIAKVLAISFDGTFKQIVGNELIEQNYGLIHSVGRASNDEPRLLDIHWGNPAHPKVTLVGKGVCFDSGGLDLKPSAAMLLMKKDMGGAAHVMGLARMIMAAKLPVYLRVLIPAVENVISGNAYRPGDVIKSRKGLTVEIGNTDAEGRLVVADALAEAVNDNPELLIDITTLTGAARVALGTELPAIFSNEDLVVDAVMKQGNAINDPMWRMPLFAPYREHLNSQIADINNNSCDYYAGAISAALFLKEFVPDNIPWLHFDLMAWNTKTRPGRPQGGEAMALRALFSYIKERFAVSS